MTYVIDLAYCQLFQPPTTHFVSFKTFSFVVPMFGERNEPYSTSLSLRGTVILTMRICYHVVYRVLRHKRVCQRFLFYFLPQFVLRGTPALSSFQGLSLAEAAYRPGSP